MAALVVSLLVGAVSIAGTTVFRVPLGLEPNGLSAPAFTNFSWPAALPTTLTERRTRLTVAQLAAATEGGTAPFVVTAASAPAPLSAVARGGSGLDLFVHEGVETGTVEVTVTLQDATGAAATGPVTAAIQIPPAPPFLADERCYRAACTQVGGGAVALFGRGSDAAWMIAERRDGWANRIVVHATDGAQSFDCLGEVEGAACSVAPTGSWTAPRHLRGPDLPPAATPQTCPGGTIVANLSVCRAFNGGETPGRALPGADATAALYRRSASGFGRRLPSCTGLVEAECADLPFGIAEPASVTLPGTGVAHPLPLFLYGVAPGTPITLTASSSNPAVVPDGPGGLAITGATTTDRVLRITAAATGSTIVTVTLSDGVRSATTSFLATIDATNGVVGLAASGIAVPIQDVTLADVPTRAVPIQDVTLADVPTRAVPIQDVTLAVTPSTVVPVPDTPSLSDGGRSIPYEP